AADASGLMTTTLQFGQVVGVATLGSVFLSLAGTHSSASAFAIAFVAMAVLMLAGFFATIRR
ncbi:MFS transporter, partial [Kibdelosporangium lantanae]